MKYDSSESSYVLGEEIAVNGPKVLCETPYSDVFTELVYSVTPGLPVGLAFDSATGAISGTPETESPATDYVVTATNASGSTTVEISIEVAASVVVE